MGILMGEAVLTNQMMKLQFCMPPDQRQRSS
jgi:hypothetical protein